MENLKRDYLFYQTRKKLPFIKKAKGIYMWDHAGKEYIDACSGAVICNIGYGNPRIADAIAEQAHETFFAYRTQFENEPAVRLATELVAYSAPHLNRVFYVSGGSEAVESAMKLCRQYFYNRGKAPVICSSAGLPPTMAAHWERWRLLPMPRSKSLSGP